MDTKNIKAYYLGNKPVKVAVGSILLNPDTPAVTYHTKIVNPDGGEDYVEITFEDGMTWQDFVNSEYNDVTKMTVGGEVTAEVFTINGNDEVIGCVDTIVPSQPGTIQKASDLIIADIDYETNKDRKIIKIMHIGDIGDIIT